MITVYGHVPAWGIPDLSPYVTAIDLYMRMTDAPYKLVLGDLDKAPYGKLPYIEDGNAVVADTSFIIDYMKLHYGNPLDGALNKQDEAVRLMLWRMMDESFYWYLIQGRYRRDADFALYDPLWAQFYGHLTEVEKNTAISETRDRIMLEFYQSGRGRLTWDEVEHMGRTEINAVIDWLDGKRYLFGEKPTSADCAVYAFFQGVIYVPFENGIKDYLLSRPEIVTYMKGLSEEYYPELRDAQKEFANA